MPALCGTIVEILTVLLTYGVAAVAADAAAVFALMLPLLLSLMGVIVVSNKCVIVKSYLKVKS